MRWTRLVQAGSRAAAILAALTACAVAPALAAPPQLPFTMRSSVAYGPLAAEQGDLFLPATPDGRLRPAVLVIHGGGWISGTRTTNAWLSSMIAHRGFVVFDIDYRLGTASKPDTHWPAQLVDAQLAVRWLRANAADLHIDPARIGAVGDSAGGTLAVFLGVLDHPVPGDKANVLATEASNVTAVVDQFGIVDLKALGMRGAAMKDGLFGNQFPTPTQMDAVSPLSFVTRHSAPMLLVHGDRDDFVPLEQSKRLTNTLTANTIETRLDIYAGGHGFDGVSPADQAALFARHIDWLCEQLKP